MDNGRNNFQREEQLGAKLMCSTAWKCTELPEETFFPLNEQLKAHFPLQCVFVRG